MPKHVVLLSGGIDSAVTLILACWRDGVDEVLALTFAYGQAHVVEIHKARELAASAGVQHVHMTVDPSPWKQLPLLTGTTQRDRTVYAMRTGGISDAFLPGRNVAFLAAALVVAGVQGASHIWIGANADDAAGFPDCRPAFLNAWERMASTALDRPIFLERPLLTRTKRDVVQLARRMAIDLDRTWSCYRPRTHHLQVEPCGRCDACVLRAEALAC